MAEVILLFPGQGSQKPGMARDLAEAFPEAKAVLDTVDETLGHAFTRVMFEGPAEELTATHNAQPALLAHAAAAWRVLEPRLRPHVRAAAGHSLGEYSAYHVAGALPLREAVRLVRRRGELMHDAGVAAPGTMAAVLGTLARPVGEICEQASAEAGRVVPANYNSDEQVVIAGEVAGVERAMELAKEAGARRTVKLAVAGAFHSPLMAPAGSGLAVAIDAAPFAAPMFPIYSNVTAAPVAEAAAARDTLRRQLTAPVRWTELVRNMAGQWPEALYIEIGPGAVLGGLVSRIIRGARTLSCGTAAEIDKVLNTLPS